MERLEDFYMEGIPLSEQKDLITVAVSCYNVERFLPRCIESIINQTYKNLEIILIDDGARDNTGAICDHYATLDSRIRVIHQNNGGPAVARNMGITEAKGEYVTFVDGDDYVDPIMYEYLLYALKKTGADMSVCRYFEDDEGSLDTASIEEKKGLITIKEKKTIREEAPRSGLVIKLTKDELLTKYVEESEEIVIRNAPWNKLYKRETLLENQFPNQRYYEDILFSVKVLAAVDTAAYVDTPLYHYIINRKGGIMSTTLRQQIITEQIPSYHERSRFLEIIGRADLARSHDYLVYKKLLLLYTEARRDETGELKKYMEPLAREIRTCADQMYRIFSCDIANPHQKMRMELFLKHPKLYDMFMDVNDGFVLPLRQKIRGKNKKR